MPDKLFVGLKALIVHEGKILFLRESSQYSDGTNAGLLDVCGGRMNIGEHPQEALLREVKEETGLMITIGQPVYVGEWRPVVRGEEWQVIGIYFLCYTNTTEVSLSQDHSEYIWATPAEARQLPLFPNVLLALDAYEKLCTSNGMNKQ